MELAILGSLIISISNFQARFASPRILLCKENHFILDEYYHYCLFCSRVHAIADLKRDTAAARTENIAAQRLKRPPSLPHALRPSLPRVDEKSVLPLPERKVQLRARRCRRHYITLAPRRSLYNSKFERNWQTL